MSGPDNPSAVINLADFEPLARQRLDQASWAYFAGGAGDEITLQANRQAWDALRLLPRVLRPLAGISTQTQLFGRRWPSPLLMAPMAAQRLAHADGEPGAALACAALGAGYVLSTQSGTTMESLAAPLRHDPDRGPLCFQLYPLGDLAWQAELLQRAAAAGYDAVLLTVDAPVSGARDRERRAGFRLPAALTSAHLPPARVGTDAQATAVTGTSRGLARDPAQWAGVALGWRDLEALCAASPLPLLVKGVLHPQDARDAVAAGAAGVVVSNHGGRTLDTALPGAEALPHVVDALAGQTTAVGAAPVVLVDGGIRRGTDVLKALALGASGVLVGRPLLWALAAQGAHGVAQALRLLQDELLMAMALCGCQRPDDADRSLLA